MYLIKGGSNFFWYRSVMLPYDVGKLKKIVLNGNELKAEDIKITKINNLSQLQQTFFDTYEASSPDTFDGMYGFFY